MIVYFYIIVILIRKADLLDVFAIQMCLLSAPNECPGRMLPAAPCVNSLFCSRWKCEILMWPSHTPSVTKFTKIAPQNNLWTKCWITRYQITNIISLHFVITALNLFSLKTVHETANTASVYSTGIELWVVVLP